MDAQALISEILRREISASGETLLTDIDGWDSLKGVRLMLRLEEEVKRELSESELEGISCVEDVSRILRPNA